MRIGNWQKEDLFLFLIKNTLSPVMSARAAMRTMRSFSQSVRLSQRCMFVHFLVEWFYRKPLRAFDVTPQMKLKSSFRINQIEYLNKKMSNAYGLAKINKAEVVLIKFSNCLVTTNADCYNDSNGYFFICSDFKSCGDFGCYSFL